MILADHRSDLLPVNLLSNGLSVLRFNTLDEWLAWQQALHSCAIELGLERVGDVARKLGLLTPSHRLITVAGTNGKGSSVAMLESILCAAGYRVGSYSSPHLLRYNERIRLDRMSVSDDRICQAFGRVDDARGDTSLSYFEFGTLAAMEIFADSHLDVVILEVGLGGRLDAVNIQDADVALITGIALDHTEWLGADRDSIGHEKAGIMRRGRPAVCNDSQPPASILNDAEVTGATLYCADRDYRYSTNADSWDWSCAAMRLDKLPFPALFGPIQLQNASGVLMVLSLLVDQLPASVEDIHNGLSQVSLIGRFQRVGSEPETILDVAHNPDGASVFARSLTSLPFNGKTHAVFAVLADKDDYGIVEAMRGVVDYWNVAGLYSPRALPAEELCARMQTHLGEGANLSCFETTQDAYLHASQSAGSADRIIVFGSAFTVAEVLSLIE